jgi:hypothetical protein
MLFSVAGCTVFTVDSYHFTLWFNRQEWTNPVCGWLKFIGLSFCLRQPNSSRPPVKLPPAKPGAYQWGASKALANHEPPKGGYTPNFIWS